MNLLKQIGIIDFEMRKREITYENILGLYRNFFADAGYESHLLANDKLLRTVMSNDTYPDLYAENSMYHLELNRRLIDLAWLYLTYKEGEGEKNEISPVNDPDKYRPKFCYRLESTYYFDDYSWLNMEFDSGYKPFYKEDDYKEVIYRFKGKVRWLSLDEIENPYGFYRTVFENRTHLDWIQLLSKWGEYTFLRQSICQEIDGGEIYDTYVLFQKLTEMAYLVYNYDDCIPDSRKFLYYDSEEYPSNLTIDEIISPQLVLLNVFEKSNVETVLNEMFWWLDSILNGQDINDFKRVYDIYTTTLSIVEFCWIFRPNRIQGNRLEKKAYKDKDKFYNSFFESLNYQTRYLAEKEKLQPLSALNWIFSQYNRELVSLGSLLKDCFKASFEKQNSSLEYKKIESLKTNCAKFFELAYLFHLVLSKD